VRDKYLGDSFDIVKRFFAERVSVVGPLVAHPRFVSPRLRPAFEKMMGMSVLSAELPQAPFGLFLDPHTGIPLPDSSSRTATASHAPVQFIADEFARLQPRYVICFDQSHDRSCGVTRVEQRKRKTDALRGLGLESFYYVSHAPFLFAANDGTVLKALRSRLVESGIPAWRLDDEAENG
jgi:hypothetical protein